MWSVQICKEIDSISDMVRNQTHNLSLIRQTLFNTEPQAGLENLIVSNSILIHIFKNTMPNFSSWSDFFTVWTETNIFNLLESAGTVWHMKTSVRDNETCSTLKLTRSHVVQARKHFLQVGAKEMKQIND